MLGFGPVYEGIHGPVQTCFIQKLPVGFQIQWAVELVSKTVHSLGDITHVFVGTLLFFFESILFGKSCHTFFIGSLERCVNYNV